MLHPSYAELIKVINSEVESGDTPVVNSRYSVVLATAKRAREIIDGRKPLSRPAIDKPLSIAVDELNKGLIKIQTEEEAEAMALEMAAAKEARERAREEEAAAALSEAVSEAEEEDQEAEEAGQE